MTYDIILVTQKEYLNPKEKTTYIKNVLLEDQLVQNALEKLDLKVKRVAWDDTSFPWENTKLAVIRATWDYFHRFSEFSKWLESVSKKTTLINSKAIIDWNIDKHYLFDLQKKGIAIPETHLLKKGSTTTLKEVHTSLQWNETILKPCVSGSARHTYKLTPENLENHENLFASLISEEAFLLQTFQHNIVSKGEISLMFFNGIYTHAVLKKAKKGDFRVQDDFGGTVEKYEANLEEINFSKKAIEACFSLPVYARVDFFYNNKEELVLGELELIEPELWFRLHPEASNIFAKQLYNILKH